MKRNFLLILLIIVCSLCTVYAFTACKDSDDGNKNDTEQGGTNTDPDDGKAEHIHDWGEWIVTEEAGCEKKGEETRICKTDAKHTEIRTIFSVSHDWQENYSYNETHHYKKCNNCTAIKEESTHEYSKSDLNLCEVCGYEVPETEGLEFELNRDEYRIR